MLRQGVLGRHLVTNVGADYQYQGWAKDSALNSTSLPANDGRLVKACFWQPDGQSCRPLRPENNQEITAINPAPAAKAVIRSR